MKRSLASAAFGLSLLACGGEGEGAPVSIMPLVETPVVETPTPTVTPTTPTLPTTNENEGDSIEELDHEPAQLEVMHKTMTYGRVAYAAPVQQAIETQLRAVMRQRMEYFDTDSGDPENPNTFDMRCDVTLATAEFVGYMCVAETMGGRGESTLEGSSHGWEVVGETVRELQLDDLLIAGVQGEMLGEGQNLADSPMAPTAFGIKFMHEDGETEEIAYAELGALINVHSVLRRIRPAMAVATDETSLFLQARPPALIRVFTPAQPFARAVLQASALGARWLFAEQGSAPIDVGTPVVFDAREPAGRATAERSWTTPARLMMLRLKRPAQLRPAPRGRGAGVTLLASTRVYAVLGELSAGASRTGGGQWTLVVASEGLVGWLPSGLLQRVPQSNPESVMRSVDAFVAGLPEAERVRVRADAVAVTVEQTSYGFGVIGYATGSEGSVLGYVPSANSRQPALRAWLQHEGVLADVRVVPQTSSGTGPLLLVAWLLPSDPTHHQWEAYAMPTDGVLAQAPVFTLTLPLPTAARRERVTVTTALLRRNQFYPFVVRGPGRLETLYTWNGTTLVPPSTAN